VAIYIAIRYWKAPTSILPRTKARFVIALILGVAQVVGWVLLIGMIWTHGSGR
jgi:hypothetical protein